MSDSIENILIGLVRESNDHIDRFNVRVLSNNKLLHTLVEKVTKIEEENKCLREKMDSVIETNTRLREKIEVLEKPAPEHPKKKTKVPKEPKVECSEMTAKGNKCTKPCIPGETCCTLHMKMRERRACLPVPTEPKKKRPILKKKRKRFPYIITNPVNYQLKRVNYVKHMVIYLILICPKRSLRNLRMMVIYR